jgi:putative transcriptional regulator
VTAADWVRLDAMTDPEVLAVARADPDARPLTEAQLARMRRVSLARHVRWTLAMSQSESARAFHIPTGTLRDWEQHPCEPDQAAQAYLKVIARNPQVVRKALADAA